MHREILNIQKEYSVDLLRIHRDRCILKSVSKNGQTTIYHVTREQAEQVQRGELHFRPAENAGILYSDRRNLRVSVEKMCVPTSVYNKFKKEIKSVQVEVCLPKKSKEEAKIKLETAMNLREKRDLHNRKGNAGLRQFGRHRYTMH